MPNFKEKPDLPDIDDLEPFDTMLVFGVNSQFAYDLRFDREIYAALREGCQSPTWVYVDAVGRYGEEACIPVMAGCGVLHYTAEQRALSRKQTEALSRARQALSGEEE